MSNRILESPPPHNLDMEKAVLGSTFFGIAFLEYALRELTPKDFYQPAHQKIFKAILEIHDRGIPVDLHTLTDKLKKEGLLDVVGGPGYYASFERFVLSPSNISYYCKAVKEYSLNRQLLEQSINITERVSFGLSGSELKEEITSQKQALEKISSGILDDEEGCINVGESARFAEVERMYVSTGRAIKPVPSYLSRLNALQRGGYLIKDMSLLVGGSGKGKTGFAISELVHKAVSGYKSVFFSTELTYEVLIERIDKQGIGFVDVPYGEKLSNEVLDRIGKYHSYIQAKLDQNLYFKYEARLTPQIVDEKLERLKNKDGVNPQFVVIDHFTTMFTSPRSRAITTVDKQDEMARELGAIAGKYDAAFLVLSQVPKPRENSVELTIEDAKGSGTIVNKAKFVMTLSHFTNEYIERKRLDFPPLHNENDYYVRLASVKSNEGGALNVYTLVYDYNYRLIRPLGEYQDIYRNAARE